METLRAEVPVGGALGQRSASRPGRGDGQRTPQFAGRVLSGRWSLGFVPPSQLATHSGGQFCFLASSAGRPERLIVKMQVLVHPEGLLAGRADAMVSREVLEAAGHSDAVTAAKLSLGTLHILPLSCFAAACSPGVPSSLARVAEVPCVFRPRSQH